MLSFTNSEQRLIKQFSVKDGWNSKRRDVSALKKKIKKYFEARAQPVMCCYCRRNLHTVHGLTIDPEHILPKGKFPQYTFELRNLSLSCKRCNMGVKGEITSFFDNDYKCTHPFTSHQYSFIHPNLDSAKSHLKIVMYQDDDDDLLIKYKVAPGSLKGAQTYEFFDLEKIEINTFDGIQGIDTVEVSSDIPQQIVEELEGSAEELEQ